MQGNWLLILLGTALPSLASATALPSAVAHWQAAPAERIFEGTVEAVNKATVAAQTGGRVARLPYDVNDFVPKGAVIVQFTDREQRAAVQKAGALLAEVRARRTQTEAAFRRIQRLRATGAASQNELDRALANRNAARARVQAAESALTEAHKQLDYTVVKAPYAGIVTARHVEVGETVSPGQALMTGLSLDRLRVRVDLPQTVVQAVRRLKKAFVELSDRRLLEAAGVTVFPYADSHSNSFRVRLQLPPQENSGLYPGMFVKTRFVVGRTRRLLVPEPSVLRRSELTAVYVLGKDKAPQLRQVRLGARFGEQREILAGLADGERVALDPVAAALQEVKENQDHE